MKFIKNSLGHYFNLGMITKFTVHETKIIAYYDFCTHHSEESGWAGMSVEQYTTTGEAQENLDRIIEKLMLKDCKLINSTPGQ